MIEDGIFFRPEEVAREHCRIPANLFNRCRLLFRRGKGEPVVLPVHTMQYQAVIDSREIYFVDIHAYAVRDGKGGKLIMLAWVFDEGIMRDSLNKPVDFELVFYRPNIRDIHLRLMSEFPKALERVERNVGELMRRKSRGKVLRFPE